MAADCAGSGFSARYAGGASFADGWVRLVDFCLRCFGEGDSLGCMVGWLVAASFGGTFGLWRLGVSVGGILLAVGGRDKARARLPRLPLAGVLGKQRAGVWTLQTRANPGAEKDGHSHTPFQFIGSA